MTIEDLEAVLEYTKQLREEREQADEEIAAAHEACNTAQKDLFEARERIRQLTDLWHTWEKKAEAWEVEAKKASAVADARLGELLSNYDPELGKINRGAPISAPMCNPKPEPAPVGADPILSGSDPGCTCGSTHGDSHDPSSGVFSHGTAPVQSGQLRCFLVEVAPQKDEKHGNHAQSFRLHWVEDDPGELRLSLDFTKAAMSVKELPEMPTMPDLVGIFRHSVNAFEPEPRFGIRAVLRACGLEVKEQ